MFESLKHVLLVAAGAAILAGPAHAAPAAGGTALPAATQATAAEPADCRLVLPPGELSRAEWLAGGTLALSLRGKAPEAPIASDCVLGARTRPEAGGIGIVLEFTPGSLRSIDVSTEGAILMFRRIAPGPAGFAGAGGYRIGPDDVLTISVPSHNLTRDVVVDRSGSIAFDYVQGGFAVGGLSPIEAARALQGLLNRDLVNPEVSVVVKEYASQYVFVTGLVRKPGKVALRGATTLKDVLAEAGGLEKEASDDIVVTRQKEGGPAEVFHFSKSKVEGEAANLALQPRDEINVPERPYYYIQGEVQVPSQYPYRPGITLMQSIAIANGLKEWANRKDIRILRISNGRADKLVFNLRDIERQKAPDPVLEPGDNIIVPKRVM